MKTFFKDYVELWKLCMGFYKKHWIGMLVYILICMALIFVPGIVENLKYKLELRKMKKGCLPEN